MKTRSNLPNGKAEEKVVPYTCGYGIHIPEYRTNNFFRPLGMIDLARLVWLMDARDMEVDEPQWGRVSERF